MRPTLISTLALISCHAGAASAQSVRALIETGPGCPRTCALDVEHRLERNMRTGAQEGWSLVRRNRSILTFGSDWADHAAVSVASGNNAGRAFTDLRSTRSGIVLDPAGSGFVMGQAGWSDVITITLAGAAPDTLTRLGAAMTLSGTGLADAFVSYQFNSAQIRDGNGGFQELMSSLGAVRFGDTGRANRSFAVRQLGNQRRMTGRST